MENTSNILAIKDTAKTFLYLDVEETPVSPIVVQHPIFETGITMIKHNGKNVMVNIMENEQDLQHAREFQKKRIDKAATVFDVYSVIRKSYKLTFLKYIQDYLSQDDMSMLLADAWVSSENPNQDANVSISMAVKLFKRCNKKVLMTEEDYNVYQSLPGDFEIYRGVAVGRNPKGLSWTMNKDKAEWFANRFNRNGKFGYVQQAMADRECVLAYFNTRNEDEIVISTKSLHDIKII